MTSAGAAPVTIAVDESKRVSGLLQEPRNARACYVLAHGAGAGMTHPLMTAASQGLAERGIATLRYQFPYMERGQKRPDRPPVAHAAVRAAVAEACAANDLAIVIPCHRVVKKGGGISGYRWGVRRKRALIEREHRALWQLT